MVPYVAEIQLFLDTAYIYSVGPEKPAPIKYAVTTYLTHSCELLRFFCHQYFLIALFHRGLFLRLNTSKITIKIYLLQRFISSEAFVCVCV